jgi:hypothetical protein
LRNTTKVTANTGMSPICRMIAMLIMLGRITHADPVVVHDLNPLLTGFSMPASLPSQPTSSFSMNGATGNISLDQLHDDEHLQVDAQVTQWTLRYARPLTDVIQLHIRLPWVELGGGGLDHFIESWHHTFGLPNGNRSSWPENRLLIQHDMDGQTDLLVTTPQSGWGDADLSVGMSLKQTPTNSAMLWLTAKLPTGNARRLTGSGSTDFSLSLSAEQRWLTRLGTYELLSVNRFGNGPRLVAQQRNSALSGKLAGELRLSTHWMAIAAFNGHTAIYDSTARVLGNSLQLNFGPAYRSSHWRTDFLISEDIAVNTAPDVQFSLSVTRRL